MTHKGWLLGFVLVCGALAQIGATQTAQTAVPKQGSSQSANPPQQADQDDEQPPRQSTPEIPMDAPVLTIKGYCSEKKAGAASSPDSSCQTIVTRAQFEALAAAIQPTMNPAVKRQLASLYPRLLVMAHQAESEGLDKEPRYQQMMLYTRMQILSQALTRKLQEESAKLSQAEMEDYYQKNRDMFQVYTLQRLIVPLHKQSAATTVSGAAQEADAEMTQLAEKLRGRAAAGEDFIKLQKEAFDAAGITVAAPNTTMSKMRRASIPSAHAAVLELKPGEVSPLLSDSGGHYIYKLDAREQLTLEQVREEVRGTLSEQKTKEALDKIEKSFTAETNEAYFAAPSQEGRGRTRTPAPQTHQQ
jgi:peptidyl-prolyl cis-trans isomerase C